MFDSCVYFVCVVPDMSLKRLISQNISELMINLSAIRQHFSLITIFVEGMNKKEIYSQLS